ncbi:lipopolysaccharide biosynthesis protein [Comamonadaceae bacterium G21597-S1]|nr:lipopolysaccharide biosynthesis protein [Comamonadaceae bacterium G21597-S1]
MTGVVKSAMLSIAMRWFDRAIGVVSTLILARLLVPEDFGIIAMASLVIALADVFLNLGVHIALIQNPTPTQRHYDTAWTLRLIQASVSALVVFVAAPYAGAYFKELRVVPVIQVLGACFLLGAFENIGTVNFQKEMRFAQDFILMFWKRLAGFLATMIAAWLMHSYWALVIGTVVGGVVGVANSYRMHPMRPSLSLERFREIFGVSQWMLVRGLGGYLEAKLHQFVVGGRESAAVMGAYSLADEISSMPTTELLAPINRVLFPAFVRVKSDLEELKRVFLLAQGIQVLVALPAGVGMAMVAPEAVLVLLGAKWEMAIPFVEVIALGAMAGAILASASYMLLTLGHVKLLAGYAWAQVLVFAALLFWVLPSAGALSIAQVRLGVALLSVVVFLVILMRVVPVLKPADMVRSVLRPSLGVALMAGCISFIGSFGAFASTLEMLVLKMLAGAATYSISVWAVWWLMRKPPGAETYLLENLAMLRRNKPT